MYFIIKLKQPCLENKKYHFDCVIWFFKTYPQYLNLYYIILLFLQRPRKTVFYHTKKSFNLIVISFLILSFLLI